MLPRLVRRIDQLEMPGLRGLIRLDMAYPQIIEGRFDGPRFVQLHITPDTLLYFSQVQIELLEYQKIHHEIVGEAGKQKKYDHHQRVNTVVSGKKLHFIALNGKFIPHAVNRLNIFLAGSTF